MYIFYFDESGSRDPSPGTQDNPKDHLYVLLAVGMYDRQWRHFESEISGLKLELADYLKRDRLGSYDLADCEVKSNWMRVPTARKKRSPFLSALHHDDMTRLAEAYYRQVVERNTVILSCVIDKRYLYDHINHETLHMKACEFLLERIQHYMGEYHPKHCALIVMDDNGGKLNRAVAMKHASFQRAGNRNMMFPAIVEYPFFTRSELSNGVQLADLLAYDVYHAFKYEKFDYRYFERLLPNIYRRRDGDTLDGLKVWPDRSPLAKAAKVAWSTYNEKPS